METLKEAGYRVKDACKALGISRSGYYARKAPKTVAKAHLSREDEELLEKIKEIKLNHPFWGYRRVRAWLVHREKIRVSEKKVHRLMKEHNLLASQTVRKAKRTPKRSKPRADRPRQYWGIDMTKFMIPVIGWVQLWYTKKVVGWDISYDNPKRNANRERMMRTIKEEVTWLNEFRSLEEAKGKIGG